MNRQKGNEVKVPGYNMARQKTEEQCGQREGGGQGEDFTLG